MQRYSHLEASGLPTWYVLCALYSQHHMLFHTVSASREPISRFIAGYREIRFVHQAHFPDRVEDCINPEANPDRWSEMLKTQYRKTGSENFPEGWWGENGGCHHEMTALQLHTQFFNLPVRDKQDSAAKFAAFVHDTECSLPYFSSIHTMTASHSIIGEPRYDSH
jgi:hypothetical protein